MANSSSITHTGSGFAQHRSGSARFSRPVQLNQVLIDHLAGGDDPQYIREMAHASAGALLDKVHHSQDSEVVRRVITLVDAEGIDVIAELWSSADAVSLPGALWRLYTMRSWMRRNRETLASLWSSVETPPTTASAISGIDFNAHADDIARTADSILSGAFTGDFAVALERAGVFCHTISKATIKRAQKSRATEQQAASMITTAQNLEATAHTFAQCAAKWREGTLE